MIMEDPTKSTLGNDLIQHGAIIVIAIVAVGFGYLWWVWAESWLQHVLVVALVALIGIWLRVVEGRNGCIARLMGLSQIDQTANPKADHQTGASTEPRKKSRAL